MAGKGQYDVFISYRRSDSADRATLIRSYLTEWFDDNRIFLDTHEIHQGPFPDYIEEALSTSKYFVLLVSENSFSKKVDSNEIDYYYEEIRRAINKNLTIIPVLYDDIDINAIAFPNDLKSLKLQNSIIAHAEDPLALKNKLHEFTKKRTTSLKDWIAFPLAVISIYLVVSLLSGIGMYVYDNNFTSYEDAVAEAADHVCEQNGVFYYPISHNTFVSYNPENSDITKISMSRDNAHSISISENAAFKVGFWSTAVAWIYQIMKSKYKPHNGKQYLAYIGAAVAVVAGVGLGCTVERMIFPRYRTKIIRDNIEKLSFWQNVINYKYSSVNRQLIIE